MSEKAQGLEKYTPTRLDWLSVTLNSLFQRINMPGFDSFYVVGDDGKSIILAVRFDANLNKKVVDQLINRAKEAVFMIAKIYGWDSWIEVKTDITEVNRENASEESDNS